jgi:acyl carrier protein
MQDAALAYRFIEERLDIDLRSADAGTELAALGVDSLTLLELMFEIEEKFGVHVDEQTPPPRSCGELAELLERVAGARPALNSQ